MLDFKARCPGDVRWRALGVSNNNAQVECCLNSLLLDIQQFGVSLWDTLWVPLINGQSSLVELPDKCQQFLAHAHKRSLIIWSWNKQPGSASSSARSLPDKERFVNRLPAITMQKFEGLLDNTFESKLAAVKGLVSYHAGELVEVRQTCLGQWRLIRMPGLFDVKLPEQFNAFQDEQAWRDQKPRQLSDYEQRAFHVQMQEACRGMDSYMGSIQDLQPDFRNQYNRLVVPCKDMSSPYVWVRSRSVSSLGEIIEHLHAKYDARTVYYLYLHLEIVGLKRKKVPPAGKKKKEA